MKSLMELVDQCEIAEGDIYTKTDENLIKADEFEELGFIELAREFRDKVTIADKLSQVVEYKYIKLTDDAITKYLTAKADRYNETHPETKSESGFLLAPATSSWIYSPYGKEELNPPRFINSIVEMTNDFNSTKEGTIGQFGWSEEDIKDYKSVPPTNILDILKIHRDRNIFDYFTIAKVNEVVDPLLLGRIEGVEERFFIAQWGDDVQLDDLI